MGIQLKLTNDSMTFTFFSNVNFLTCAMSWFVTILVVLHLTKAYELKDVRCHDSLEEKVDLGHRWLLDQDGDGSCVDKQDMEYQPGDRIRSCCGCLTFQCIVEENSAENRKEFLWSLTQDSDIDSRCCLNCQGLTYPEGSHMGLLANKTGGNCETEVKTSCIYNPATSHGEVTEEHILKDCCLDENGLHPTYTEVIDPPSCSIRECLGVSGHQGHKSPYWKSTQSFPDCNCCQMNGKLIQPGDWILNNNGVNLTCCEGKLLDSNVNNHNNGNPTSPTKEQTTRTTATTLPPRTTSTKDKICEVEAAKFFLGGSSLLMSNMNAWKSVAVKLLDQMSSSLDVRRLFFSSSSSTSLKKVHVGELKYLIKTYHSIVHSSMEGVLRGLWEDKTGGVVFIWIDAMGSEEELNALEKSVSKANQKNVIFFMVVRFSLPSNTQTIQEQINQVLQNSLPHKERAAIENLMLSKRDSQADFKKMEEVMFRNFKKRFYQLGYIVDVNNDRDVVQRVMKVICWRPPGPNF